MRDLPPAIVLVLRLFEPVFSERVWDWARVLVVGAILAPKAETPYNIDPKSKKR
jgi:hypothetical protein